MEQKINNMDYLIRRIGAGNINLPFPIYVHVETTSLCNASCIMCDHKNWKRNNTIITDSLFNKIAKELCEHKDEVNTVTLQVGGEPLLDTLLEDRVKLLKDGGINRIVFSTNGSLLTEERAVSILESGLDEIYFSMESINEQTYESIRQGLKFSTVMENIHNFIRLRDQGKFKTKITIRAVILNENINETDSYVDYWSKVIAPSDRVYAKTAHNFANAVDIEKELCSGCNNTPCHPLWNNLIMLCDGRVVLCCLDLNGKYVLGDINQSTIYDVWNSESILTKVREIHLEKGKAGFGYCTGCNAWY